MPKSSIMNQNQAIVALLAFLAICVETLAQAPLDDWEFGPRFPPPPPPPRRFRFEHPGYLAGRERFYPDEMRRHELEELTRNLRPSELLFINTHKWDVINGDLDFSSFKNLISHVGPEVADSIGSGRPFSVDIKIKFIPIADLDKEAIRHIVGAGNEGDFSEEFFKEYDQSPERFAMHYIVQELAYMEI